MKGGGVGGMRRDHNITIVLARLCRRAQHTLLLIPLLLLLLLNTIGNIRVNKLVKIMTFYYRIQHRSNTSCILNILFAASRSRGPLHLAQLCILV